MTSGKQEKFMKHLILVCLLLSQNSFAGIYHSNYEPRHLAVIEEAVGRLCGISTDALIQKSDSAEIIRVDQGITDVNYTTVLETQVRIDQNIFELKKLEVKSHNADMYDHQSKDWGVYSVESINCNAE
jgi:hypothetical protein